jgi:hypothetical protein
MARRLVFTAYRVLRALTWPALWIGLEWQAWRYRQPDGMARALSLPDTEWDRWVERTTDHRCWPVKLWHAAQIDIQRSHPHAAALRERHIKLRRDFWPISRAQPRDTLI